MTLPRLVLATSLLVGTRAHAAPALDLLATDLEHGTVALDVDGDGDLVVASGPTLTRLDSLGARTAAISTAADIHDLAVDRRTGNVVVVGAAGLTTFDPAFAPLWHHALPAGPARVAVGEHGTVAALAGGELHVLDERGRLRSTTHPAIAELRDVAVVDAADLVAVTGADHACDIDQLALVGLDLDGAPRWQSYASDECDTGTRGVALSRGGDGQLYVLAEVDGSLPASLRSRTSAVIDGYTDPETADPAQAAWFARVDVTGAHVLGQFFTLPDASAVVHPTAIAADEHGNVFLTGTTSHSLGAADERTTTAILDAPAGFYQVVDPSFETRLVWHPIEADGMTTDVGALALAGDRAVALLQAAPLPGHTDGALPPGPSILVWPDDHGPLEANKRPNPDTQGTFGYESGVSGSDPTCYCDANAVPGPATLLSLGALTLAGLTRPRRRR